MFLIHFNVRSLQKHIDQLNNYLVGFKNQPDIAAISETKLKWGLINRNIELESYGFLHSDSKKCAGGVGFQTKDTIIFSTNQCSKICLPNAKHLWVDIQTKRRPIAIGVVYRHSDNSATTIDKFSKEMNELFLTLNMSKRPFYCIGDININLSKISKNDAIHRYAGMLISCKFRCLMDVPTRFCASTSTLIDHIYTNDKMNPTASGVLTIFDLSDHYGIFTFISEGTAKKTLQNKTKYQEICQILKRRSFLIICILNLVISSKIIAIQLTNFLITSYQYLPKWWIYLRQEKCNSKRKKAQAQTLAYTCPA